jgi:hypothetical protein
MQTTPERKLSVLQKIQVADIAQQPQKKRRGELEVSQVE